MLLRILREDPKTFRWYIKRSTKNYEKVTDVDLIMWLKKDNPKLWFELKMANVKNMYH